MRNSLLLGSTEEEINFILGNDVGGNPFDIDDPLEDEALVDDICPPPTTARRTGARAPARRPSSAPERTATF